MGKYDRGDLGGGIINEAAAMHRDVGHSGCVAAAAAAAVGGVGWGVEVESQLRGRAHEKFVGNLGNKWVSSQSRNAARL